MSFLKIDNTLVTKYLVTCNCAHNNSVFTYSKSLALNSKSKILSYDT